MTLMKNLNTQENSMQSKILKVYRVSYGRSGVPLESREYKIEPFSPVGSIMEIIEYLSETSPVTRIECYNKDGSELEQVYEFSNNEWIKVHAK